jgi:hypothetical protein
MTLERTAGAASFIDVLDRVLDKGIVVDAWVVMALAGIDLITVRAKVVVASIETYLRFVAENRVLFVIAANKSALLKSLSVRSLSSWADVVIDRRRRQDRRRKKRNVISDRRQAERRTHDIKRDLRSLGLATVVLS